MCKKISYRVYNLFLKVRMYTGLDQVVGEKLEILFGLLSVVPYELLGTFHAIHTRIFSTGTFTDVVGTVSVVMVNI